MNDWQILALFVATALSPVVALALTLGVLLSALAVHELGHLVGGRLAGYRPWACGIGTGGRVVSLRVGGVVFFLASRQCATGLTFCGEPRFVPKRWQRIAFLAGGLLANLVVVAGCALVAHIWRDDRSVRLPALGFGFMNLIPLVEVVPWWKSLGRIMIESDGRAILTALRRAEYSAAHPAILFPVVEPLLRRIEATPAVLEYGHATANFWALLGRTDLADETLADLPEPTGDDPPGQTAKWVYFRSAVAYSAGRFDAALRGLAEAAAGFAAAGDEFAVSLTKLARIQVLIGAGRGGEASVVWDELPPEIHGDGPSYYADLIAARTGDAEAARRAAARYAAPGWEFTDPAQRVELWHDVARAAAAGKVWAEAAAAYEEAAAAADEVRDTLVFPEDQDEVEVARDAFAEKQRECQAQIGNAPPLTPGTSAPFPDTPRRGPSE